MAAVATAPQFLAGMRPVAALNTFLGFGALGMCLAGALLSLLRVQEYLEPRTWKDLYMYTIAAPMWLAYIAALFACGVLGFVSTLGQLATAGLAFYVMLVAALCMPRLVVVRKGEGERRYTCGLTQDFIGEILIGPAIAPALLADVFIQRFLCGRKPRPHHKRKVSDLPEPAGEAESSPAPSEERVEQV
jgi:hypothetical protein